jgi:hypothetical protein
LLELRALFPATDVATMVLRTRLWLADPTTSLDTLADVTERFRDRFTVEDADR